LTQDDVLRPEEVDELEAISGFKRSQITKLYRRFKILDREATGCLTKDDLLRIPEVAMNPMVNKIIPFFGFPAKTSINFKEFVQALGQFNASRTRDEKLRLVFNSFDADGDGLINHDELVEILRTLVGSEGMDNEDLKQLAQLAILEAGSEGGIDFDEFKLAISDDADFLARITTETESGNDAYFRKRDKELKNN